MRKFLVLGLLLSSFTWLSACTTTPPFSNNKYPVDAQRQSGYHKKAEAIDTSSTAASNAMMVNGVNTLMIQPR